MEKTGLEKLYERLEIIDVDTDRENIDKRIDVLEDMLDIINER